MYPGIAEPAARLRRALTALRTDGLGVTAIEYALIAALVSVLIVAAVTLVGTSVSTLFNAVATAL